MSSTLPISKTAWLDSWLNIMFSFARSSRIQILFEPILILSVTSAFLAAVSSFTASACENVSVITPFLRRASVSKIEVVCPSFLVARFASVEWSVMLCALAHCSLSASFFKELSTSVPEVECCCCWLCQFFFNVTPWCRSWSFKPFEIYWFSILRCHTINTISRYCILVIFPFSNTRCETIMRLFLLQVISKRIRWCQKHCLMGLIFLLSSWNQSLSQYGLKVSCNSSVEYVSFSHFEESTHSPSILVRLEYHQNDLESLVHNIEFHLCFYSTQSFSLSCLQRCVVATLRH